MRTFFFKQYRTSCGDMAKLGKAISFIKNYIIFYKDDILGRQLLIHKYTAMGAFFQVKSNLLVKPDWRQLYIMSLGWRMYPCMFSGSGIIFLRLNKGCFTFVPFCLVWSHRTDKGYFVLGSIFCLLRIL